MLSKFLLYQNIRSVLHFINYLVSEQDHQEYEPLYNFKDFYLATLRLQVDFYLPDDQLMNTLAALDQRKWPDPITELKRDPNVRIAFQRWPAFFGYPTTSAMNDLDQLVTFLETNCFWNNRKLASPTVFWTEVLTGN